MEEPKILKFEHYFVGRDYKSDDMIQLEKEAYFDGYHLNIEDAISAFVNDFNLALPVGIDRYTYVRIPPHFEKANDYALEQDVFKFYTRLSIDISKERAAYELKYPYTSNAFGMEWTDSPVLAVEQFINESDKIFKAQWVGYFKVESSLAFIESYYGNKYKICGDYCMTNEIQRED